MTHIESPTPHEVWGCHLFLDFADHISHRRELPSCNFFKTTWSQCGFGGYIQLPCWTWLSRLSIDSECYRSSTDSGKPSPCTSQKDGYHWGLAISPLQIGLNHAPPFDTISATEPGVKSTTFPTTFLISTKRIIPLFGQLHPFESKPMLCWSWPWLKMPSLILSS